jgi:hypothetical protein
MGSLRADGDNVAVASFLHVRDNSSAAEEGAGQVERYGLIPEIEGTFRDFAAAKQATSVGDKDIDATEALNNSGYDALYFGFLSKISMQRQSLSASCFDVAGHGSRIFFAGEIGKHYMRSAYTKRFGDASTNTRGSTCYQDDLTFEIEVH